jgi:hypothetical protein
MNEKQRRARRRAAARQWKLDSRALLPFQRETLKALRRHYRKPYASHPYLCLLPGAPPSSRPWASAPASSSTQ